ncbi:hypothetical protein COV24_05050 [candidate division WWE3 bacterium CG10_big_fil_rev_8_21_14_0_10_32_10]|uniref:Uncharacterized protein n=1 Tax=candidate division WWE3 bacterium CG10_big_fil_rev_8_21_14_0_10_32_10 TaxID=1975090 RepID=A0A2H0R908_UNCKA|nr:MAG: hypothetical protein COV24_05050 [candidate division WWE3 bacterium CG10_big_fil_rev_8_21_14_0_10_32_10]
MELTPEFIQEQKERLLKKRSELTKEINRLGSEDAYLEESKDVVGRNQDEYETDAQEDIQHSNTAKSIESITQDLDQVNKALQKIEDKKYGFDENTNERIDIARLRVYPEATTAVD